MNNNNSYANARNATEADWAYDNFGYFTVGQLEGVPAGTYAVYRGFLFFDTSVILQEANITSATLSIKLETDASSTDFNITIQNGQPTYPHDPLVVGDYYYGHYGGNGGNISTSGMSTDTYYNISMTTIGRGWVTKEGWTKLCLRSSRDINSLTPTGAEDVNIYAAESGEGNSPKLYVTYETGYTTATFYGAYNEQGTRDGAINVTVFRPEQGALTFELNGTYNITSEVHPRLVYEFDLGYNESRVYYWRAGVGYEDIYVFKPTSPYYTYYFTVVDYVGITNGYLETLINVNGTNRVVERWKLDVLNDLPFTLSWGHAYTIRLVSDQGTYVFGTYMAGATTSFTLTVTSDMFPPSSTHIGNVSVSVLRLDADSIQMNYSDVANETDWVWVGIYRASDSMLFYSTNNTGYTHQITWNSADNNTDYSVQVIAEHQTRGTLTWVFSASAPFTPYNPWNALGFLGAFPIAPNQVIGFGMVLLVFSVFSTVSAKTGIIVGILLTMVLVFVGFLDISWSWLAVTFAIAIIAVLSLAKRERGIRV